MQVVCVCLLLPNSMWNILTFETPLTIECNRIVCVSSALSCPSQWPFQPSGHIVQIAHIILHCTRTRNCLLEVQSMKLILRTWEAFFNGPQWTLSSLVTNKEVGHKTHILHQLEKLIRSSGRMFTSQTTNLPKPSNSTLPLVAFLPHANDAHQTHKKSSYTSFPNQLRYRPPTVLGATTPVAELGSKFIYNPCGQFWCTILHNSFKFMWPRGWFSDVPLVVPYYI